MNFCRNLWLHRGLIARYIVSGGTAAIVDLGILHMCDAYFQFHYLVSVNVAFVLSFLVSFSLQKYWTFKDDVKGRTMVRRQMIAYLGVSCVNLVLNSLFVKGFLVLFFGTRENLPQVLIDVVSFFTFHLLVLRELVSAQILAAAVVAFISFFVYRKLIFKRQQPAVPTTETTPSF